MIQMTIQTNEMIDDKELPPFKKFIMSIGAIPTSYLESMSYYETLLGILNLLKNAQKLSDCDLAFI